MMHRRVVGHTTYDNPSVSPEELLVSSYRVDLPAAYSTNGKLQGIIWTLTSTSFIFLCVRLLVRWKAMRRLYWDDFFVVLAWALSLAITAAVTRFNSITYEIIDLSHGLKPLPPDMMTIMVRCVLLHIVVPSSLSQSTSWSLNP
jgi:hypothetical protein